MDIEKIRILLQVIEEGSISAAAESLGYTASGISRLVASLEQEAGFALLRRNRSGVVPTEECLQLKGTMQTLVQEQQHYQRLCRNICGLETGNVTIGTAYSAFFKPLARSIAAFTNAHPGISIQVVEGTSSQLHEMMLQHQVDICFITGRPDLPRWLPLLRDELVALLGRSHPMATHEVFPVELFATEPFIELYSGRETDNSLFFHQAGIKPNTRFSSYEVSAGVAMVEEGLGITLTNALVVPHLQADVVALPLLPPVTLEIGLASLDDRDLSPAARRFWDYAVEEMQNKW